MALALAGTAFGATDAALAGTALALALGAALGVAAAAGFFEACQTPICLAVGVCCSRVLCTIVTRSLQCTYECQYHSIPKF